MQTEDLRGIQLEFRQENWFDTSYLRRVPITINASQITGEHTNFPFLFNSTLTDLILHVKSNGGDIRFVLEDKTELKSEIQFINNGTGALIAWCKLPTASVGTTFFMYYDNPSAVLPTDPENVWLNNPATETQTYVYHMTQNNTTLLDSTKNSKMTVGTVPNGVGKIGVGGSFSGSVDTETPNSGPDQASPTLLGWLSMWVNPSDIIENQYIMNFSINQWAILLGFQDNKFNFFAYPQGFPAPTEFSATAGVFQ